MKRILFYVQHLDGVGHVFRAMRIVKALTANGFDVHLVYGGATIPNFDDCGASIHFLAPLRAGSENFSDLETPDGIVVDGAYKERRRDNLLKIYKTVRPDMVVIEAFPFGRRAMRFELLPMLEATRSSVPKPVVVSSVRDILQENRKAKLNLETADIINQYFDHVLVHADKRIATLDETFPEHNKIADRVLYTGIVAAPDNPGQKHDVEQKIDVIVSVGGGASGTKLLLAAAKAKPLSTMAKANWCFVIGIHCKEGTLEAMKSLGVKQHEIKGFLDDLPSVLKRAKLSISLAGYNTVADIFQSDCRAIVVPRIDRVETEQLRRVGILKRLGLVSSLSPEEATPQLIAASIDAAMSNPYADRSWINLSGAENTAAIVSCIFEKRSLDDFR